MTMLRLFCGRSNFCNFSRRICLCSAMLQRQKAYVQGSCRSPNIREYFYYIDHQGQLFLDDARMKNFTSCFKDKKFLCFFFSRLNLTDTDDQWQVEFPFKSLCGRERNYVRCDDLPIVFTELFESKDDGKLRFVMNNCGPTMSEIFEPGKLCMLPENGRVYYPAKEQYGGIGLVKSSLAIEFSRNFVFNNGENRPPTAIKWNENFVTLDNSILERRKLLLNVVN